MKLMNRLYDAFITNADETNETNTNEKDDKQMEIKEPNFNEPKGLEYKKAVNDIQRKVEAKRRMRSDSTKRIKRLQKELQEAKHNVLMAEDEFEKMEATKKKKEVEEEIENTEDYSQLDLKVYARKLYEKHNIEELRQGARKEYNAIRKQAISYQKELEREYNAYMKKHNAFTAHLGADSFTREADVTLIRLGVLQ